MKRQGESADVQDTSCRVPARPVHAVRRQPDPVAAGRWLGVGQRLQPGCRGQGRQGRAVYRAHAADIISHVGLATSDDGIHFLRHPEPVLSPSELDASQVPTPWSKAGAILATPIDGRYLMYFGEGSIYHAWSDDLIHWTPGPQDTNNGLILLLHNAAVRFEDGTVRYTCGQLLFDPKRPTEVLAQLNYRWLEPSTYEDQHGLVSNVTFVEGLVEYQGTWFAYYGQGDSTIGVATYKVGQSYSGLA